MLKLFIRTGLIMAFSFAVHAQGLTSQMDKCAMEGSHAGERACLSREAKRSQIELEAVEKSSCNDLLSGMRMQNINKERESFF